MCTVRCSDHRRGCTCPGGVYLSGECTFPGDVPARRVPGRGCVYPSMHWGRHPATPCEQIDWQTLWHVHTLHTNSFKPKTVLCWRSLTVGTQNTISVILCNYLCWQSCDTGTDVSKKSSRISFPENNSQRLLHFPLLTTTLSAKIYPICAMTFHANCCNSEFCSVH